MKRLCLDLLTKKSKLFKWMVHKSYTGEGMTPKVKVDMDMVHGGLKNQCLLKTPETNWLFVRVGATH